MAAIMPNRSSIVKRNPYPLKHVVYYRRRNPKRPLGRKSVTICAGFICTDGLLLTADTEVTVSEGKHDQSKIRRFQFSGGEYVLTGAGSMSFVGMASDMIAAKLYENRGEFLGDSEERKGLFFDVVQETILTIHRDHIASYPYQDTPPGFALILGVHFKEPDEKLALLYCAGDGGVYWSEADVFEGTGASIAELFSNILCGERLPIDVMRPISIFCLHQAKLGAAGCGGGSHTFTLPTPKSSSLWDEERISELPHLGMRLCLVDARDTRITKEEFQKRVDDFRARLIAIREAVEQEAISDKFILEVLRKRGIAKGSVTTVSTAPEPPPEQSGGAVPVSGS